MFIRHNHRCKCSNGHDVKIVQSLILNGRKSFIVEDLKSGWWLVVDKQVIDCNGSGAGFASNQRNSRDTIFMTDNEQSGLFSGGEPRQEPEIKTINLQSDNLNPIALTGEQTLT